MDFSRSDGGGNDDHDNLVVQVENLKIGDNLGILSNDESICFKNENTGFVDSNLDTEGPIQSKSLQKCSTFPIPIKDEIAIKSQPENNKSCKRSQSLPTVHKLISALKGSREKEGITSSKLTVSWAPDVYDPPPTSLSHFPKKKSQQVVKYGKKHGKGKQKGKNTRGGGSGPKEKKHHRKTGGRSDKCLDLESERVISSSNKYRSLDIMDFDDDINISNPDHPNCSSNFLGQVGGTMHCVC